MLREALVMAVAATEGLTIKMLLAECDSESSYGEEELDLVI